MEEAIPYTRSDHVEEEDSIDMEVLPSDSAIFSSSSHPASIDFEFQMLSITSSERYTPSTSPADELFCKGKLLPLHLPPRLQMLRKLLENTNTFSPFNSCHVSTEPIRPDTEEGINEEASKGGSFSSKVKASRAYFKSLFSKSSSALTGKSLEKGDNGSGYEESGRRRRSFSGASKRLLSPTKVSSQRFSITSDYSNGYPEKPLFRRSSSGRYSWDREDSIQEAIDYCKRSQH